MKINKYFLITGFFLFFNNFLCFFSILYDIYKKKWSPIILSMFMGILAYYFIPFINSDLYRYYQLFDNSFQRDIIFRQQKDYFAKTLILFIISNDISRNFLAFFTSIFCYYFFFKSLHKIIQSRKINSRKYYFYFISYFITIPLTCYQGIRFYPAVSLFVFSIILNLTSNKNYYLFFMLLSILIHISMIFPICIFILYTMLKNKMNKKQFKYMLLGAFICGIFINADIIKKIYTSFYNILSFIPMNYIEEYIGGKFGVNSFKNLSIQGIIAHCILQILKTSFLFIYVFFNKNKNIINKYIYLLIFFSLFFIKFRTIYDRFFYWNIYLMLLISIYDERKYEKISFNFLFFYIVLFLYNIFLLIMFIRTQYENIILSYYDISKPSLINIIYGLIFR